MKHYGQVDVHGKPTELVESLVNDFENLHLADMPVCLFEEQDISLELLDGSFLPTSLAFKLFGECLELLLTSALQLEHEKFLGNTLACEKILAIFNIYSGLSCICLFHILSFLKLAKRLVHHPVKIIFHDLVTGFLYDLMSQNQGLFRVLDQMLKVILLEDVQQG